MTETLRHTLIVALGLISGTVPIHQQDAGLSQQDRAIYEAVIAKTIRPEVDKLRANGAGGPSIVLALDHTIPLCRRGAAPPRVVGCLGEDEFRFFTGEAGMRRSFQAQLNNPIRNELAKSLLERNTDSHPFPGANLEGVVVTTPERLDDARKETAGRTVGFASFTLPAYSSDNRAVVYASYVCGNLCGYGWLILLERRDGAWQVVSAEMLWIS